MQDIERLGIFGNCFLEQIFVFQNKEIRKQV